jgi:hypothetical protein
MVSLGSGDVLAVILCGLGWPLVAEGRTRSKQTKVERTLGARVNRPRLLPRCCMPCSYWRTDSSRRLRLPWSSREPLWASGRLRNEVC